MSVRFGVMKVVWVELTDGCCLPPSHIVTVPGHVPSHSLTSVATAHLPNELCTAMARGGPLIKRHAESP